MVWCIAPMSEMQISFSQQTEQKEPDLLAASRKRKKTKRFPRCDLALPSSLNFTVHEEDREI